MTIEGRLIAYEDMLQERIDTPDFSKGFCYQLERIAGPWEGEGDFSNDIEDYPELMHFCPSRLTIWPQGSHWFEFWNNTIRIEILKTIISQMKENISDLKE